MVVVYRFLSRNRPVLLFPHRSDLYRYSDSRQPRTVLIMQRTEILSSDLIITHHLQGNQMLQFIGGHPVGHILDCRPGKPAMPAFAPISSNCSATLVLQGAATAQPLATRLSALFSTTFFPAPAPAAAPATSPLAMPPAIPADSVASVLTVCF